MHALCSVLGIRKSLSSHLAASVCCKRTSEKPQLNTPRVWGEIIKERGAPRAKSTGGNDKD